MVEICENDTLPGLLHMGYVWYREQMESIDWVTVLDRIHFTIKELGMLFDLKIYYQGGLQALSRLPFRASRA